MIYLVDGSKETGGFAPYASRFTNGGYIHGVPVNAPRKSLIEYSPTLGTTPRSHMCVRNATSHAKFVYDWAPVNELLFSFLIKKSYLCATLFNLMLLRICLYLFLLFLPANYTTTRSSSP